MFFGTRAYAGITLDKNVKLQSLALEQQKHLAALQLLKDLEPEVIYQPPCHRQGLSLLPINQGATLKQTMVS